MKEYKLKKETFMGGWFINPKLCDDLIKFYNQTPDFWKHKGALYTLNKGGENSDQNKKKSTDLTVRPQFGEPFITYEKELLKCLQEYQKKYYVGIYTGLDQIGLVKEYNVQYYKPKEGFFHEHCERGSYHCADRVLVFTTYLNDVEDGGTNFSYQKVTTPAKKGLTLIWPAEWTHMHRGQISEKYEKYIVTGWLHFVPPKDVK